MIASLPRNLLEIVNCMLRVIGAGKLRADAVLKLQPVDEDIVPLEKMMAAQE